MSQVIGCWTLDIYIYPHKIKVEIKSPSIRLISEGLIGAASIRTQTSFSFTCTGGKSTTLQPTTATNDYQILKSIPTFYRGKKKWRSIRGWLSEDRTWWLRREDLVGRRRRPSTAATWWPRMFARLGFADEKWVIFWVLYGREVVRHFWDFSKTLIGPATPLLSLSLSPTSSVSMGFVLLSFGTEFGCVSLLNDVVS